MIEINGLTRRYGKTVAVDNITTRISRGEIVGLLGHNGAGKTTMMKVLTGFLEPSSGTVSIDGADVVKHRSSVQSKIGYLPENAPLYQDMMVQDYLLTLAKLRGLDHDAARSGLKEAVQAAGLTAHLLHPIRTLSKGFRQRVGIAQAIIHKPDVLILDEPTNGLDPSQIQAIRGLIRKLGQHSTVLLSTHILQEIEAVCDRVLVLINGRLVADAPLSELISSNQVLLSVLEPKDEVQTQLMALNTVQSVHNLGLDPHLPQFTSYRIECTPGTASSPSIAQIAVERGWQIGSIGAEHRTLEQVFKELEAEQAKQAAEGVAS